MCLGVVLQRGKCCRNRLNCQHLTLWASQLGGLHAEHACTSRGFTLDDKVWAAGVDTELSAMAQLTYVGPHVHHCVTWDDPHAMLEVRLLLEDLIPQKFDICLADAFDLQCMSQRSLNSHHHACQLAAHRPPSHLGVWPSC